MTRDDAGPPDPQLDPEQSPGRLDPTEHDVEVSRDDVTIGEADATDFTAADTEPIADATEEEVVAMLTADPAHVRRRAALALAERDPSVEAVEALAAVARSDDDTEVRQFAVEALGRIAADRGEPDGHERQETVETKRGPNEAKRGPSEAKRGPSEAERGPNEAKRELSETVARDATTDPNPWVRAEAVVALDRIDREGFADRIAAGLDDDHEAVRRNAVISLYRVRGAEAVEDLLELLTDPSDRVREWAAHLLGDVDDDRADAALSETARSDDSDVVRATAARALGMADEELRDVVESGRATTDAADVLNRRPDV